MQKNEQFFGDKNSATHFGEYRESFMSAISMLN
jgi:hypothetical protein